MTSALGFVNSQGGKTILSSNNNPETINVTLPAQGGTLLTSANGVLAGTIQSFAFKSAPLGWLVCDGTVLKRATYPELFQAIGTTFNTGGEAADEFRIPDMGGQFLRGWVNGQTVDAGRVFGSKQEDGVGPLTLNDPGHSHTVPGYAGSTPQSAIGGPNWWINGGNTATTNVKTGITFGGTIDETRPYNIAILFCIYAGQTDQFYVTQSTATDGTPAGVVLYSAGNAAPTGWLVCDGSSISQTTYSALFKAIGTTYGGDATTFKLPDLRGEFIRGWDNGKGTDPGRAFGSSQDDQFQGHDHTYQIAGGPSRQSGSDTPCLTGLSQANTGTIVSDGSSGEPRFGSETRPNNVALLPIIKY